MLTVNLCHWLTASILCMWAPQSVPATPQQQPTGEPGYLREMRYIDVDRDRRIDAREFAEAQQGASMLLMLSWEDCDKDGDGALSHAEFEAAADEAMQALLETDDEADESAEDELAELISMQVLIDRLGHSDQYADELAALRAAVENMDDDETVVTHIVQNPTRYPHLVPVVRTWVRHYPVKPGLRRHLKPYNPLPAKYRAKAGRTVKKPAGVKPGKPGLKPNPKATRPPKP